MKRRLLNNLKNDVYCRVGVSKVHGVGVIAIKDIPIGVNPFRISSGECAFYKIIKVDEKEVKKLDKEVQRIIVDFYGYEDGYYNIPYEGPNMNDVSYYMNESEDPNVEIIELDDCELVVFRTLKKIKKGEELFINYTF